MVKTILESGITIKHMSKTFQERKNIIQKDERLISRKNKCSLYKASRTKNIKYKIIIDDKKNQTVKFLTIDKKNNITMKNEEKIFDLLVSLIISKGY